MTPRAGPRLFTGWAWPKKSRAISISKTGGQVRWGTSAALGERESLVASDQGVEWWHSVETVWRVRTAAVQAGSASALRIECVPSPERSAARAERLQPPALRASATRWVLRVLIVWSCERWSVAKLPAAARAACAAPRESPRARSRAPAEPAIHRVLIKFIE